MGEEETVSVELKKLLKDQKTTGTLISKFTKNTEKLGASNLTFDALTNRLTVIENYWCTYLRQHTELSREDETLGNESCFINDDFSETEVQYTQAKTFVTEKISALCARAQDNAGLNEHELSANTIQLATASSSLPKLDLPKFRGKQSDWDSFQAIFTSMVKDVLNITPTLKMQHLLHCLEDDAQWAKTRFFFKIK